MGYTKDAIKGISWLGTLEVIFRGITFIKTIVLARIFLPSQFGIIGIATLVLSLFEVFTETGVVVFLIQDKNNLSEFLNETWLISIIRGSVISFFILVSSSFVANFFHTQEVFPLLLLASIVPFIRGFINPAVINFQKKLIFHKEFSLRITVYLVDTVISILLALITKNISSIVWGLIISTFFELFVSFIFVKPLPKIHFTKNKIMYVLGMGKWITIFNIFGYLSSQTDNAVVGKFLNTTSLGLYELAYKLAITPVTEITDIITQVVFPIYAKIADDKKRLWNAFLKTSVLLSLPVIFLGLCIFLFPKEVILLLLGKKWLQTVNVLKILALYGIIRGIFGSAASLFLSVGRNDLAAGMTIVRFAGLAISIIPLVVAFGINGAGFSVLFSAIVEIPFILFGLYLIFV